MLAVMANVGYQVIGMDIDQAKVSRLSATYQPTIYEPGLAETLLRCRDRITFTSSYREVMEGSEAVFITVGTPVNGGGEPDTSALDTAVANLAQHLRRGQTLVLRSTVSPGTTEAVARRLEQLSGLQVEVDFFLSFCPERTIEGIAMYELQNLPHIIGGIGPESTARTAAIMKSLCHKTVTVNSPVVAELCKLVDNVYRALNIAFANELGAVCERAGVDAYDVVQAVNSAYPRTTVFRPGLGADGPCLSKDPLILRHFAQSTGITTPLIDSSVQVNTAATRRVSEEVACFLEEHRLARPQVAFLGLAFKGMPETDDLRGSAAMLVYQRLHDYWDARRVKPQCRFYDPIVTKFNGHTVEASMESCISGANVVLFLSDHPALRNVPCGTLLESTARPLLVVDAWHNVANLDRESLGRDVQYIRIGDGG
jgi:nucleotide sugar dehydrogenase